MAAKYIEDFLRAMDIISQSSIEKAGYDKTVTGVIEKVEDEKEGRYKVRIADVSRSIYGEPGFNKGDTVYVLVPQSDFNEQLRIIGRQPVSVTRATKSRGGYSPVGAFETFYSGDIAWNGNTILYDKNSNDNILSINNYQMQASIKYAQGLLIGANFTTTFPTAFYINEKFSDTNFGLKITLSFIKEGIEESRIYSLGVNDMNGFPYQQDEIYQEKFIPIVDVDDFSAIEKVEFFLDEYPEDLEEQPDLKISNIKIVNLQEINYLEGDGSLKLITDESYTELEASLFTKINNYFNIDFKLYIDNPGTNEGWTQIKKSDIKESQKSIQTASEEAITPSEIRTFTFADLNNICPRSEGTIKCVVEFEYRDEANLLQKGIIESNSVIIENKSQTDLEINIIEEAISNSLVNLKCNSDSGKYRWIKNSLVLTGAENQSLEVNRLAIDLSATYSCALLNENGYYIGMSNEIVVRQAIEYSNRAIIEGARSFLYNGGGEALESSIDSPLRLVLFDEFGKEITLDENNCSLYASKETDLTKQYSVEWKVPTEYTMIVNGSASSSTPWSFSYEIASQYDYTKINNTISVYIRDMTKEVLEDEEGAKVYTMLAAASVDIGFLVNGQPGTNGTDYICRIVRGVDTIDGIVYERDFKDWIAVSQGANLKTKTIFRSLGGEEIEGESYEWSWLNAKDSLGFASEASITGISTADVLVCKVTYDEKTYYGYLPIAVYTGDYPIILENTGIGSVLYSSAGINPQYKRNSPFILASATITTTKPAASSFKDGKYLWVPAKKYDGNGIDSLEITSNIGNITIPILQSLNRWELEMLNDWDGQALEIGGDYLIGAQAGFGQKNSDNSFTGVVLGTIKKETEEETGLFGLQAGARTFSIEAETGNATFNGKIQATSGFIGQNEADGWLIGVKSIYNGTTGIDDSVNKGTYIGIDGIRQNGDSKYVKIQGGVLDAYGANIIGTIKASGGYIGGETSGWSIGTGAIFNGTTSIDSSIEGTYIGIDGIKQNGSSTDKNVIIKDGILKAQGVDITGIIKASSGYLGYINEDQKGWFISEQGIESPKLVITDEDNKDYDYVTRLDSRLIYESGEQSTRFWIGRRLTGSVDTVPWEDIFYIRPNGVLEGQYDDTYIALGASREYGSEPFYMRVGSNEMSFLETGLIMTSSDTSTSFSLTGITAKAAFSIGATTLTLNAPVAATSISTRSIIATSSISAPSISASSIDAGSSNKQVAIGGDTMIRGGLWYYDSVNKSFVTPVQYTLPSGATASANLPQLFVTRADLYTALYQWTSGISNFITWATNIGIPNADAFDSSTLQIQTQ